MNLTKLFSNLYSSSHWFLFVFYFLCTFAFATHNSGGSNEDKTRRVVKPNPVIMLPVESKPPRERKSLLAA